METSKREKTIIALAKFATMTTDEVMTIRELSEDYGRDQLKRETAAEIITTILDLAKDDATELDRDQTRDINAAISKALQTIGERISTLENLTANDTLATAAMIEETNERIDAENARRLDAQCKLAAAIQKAEEETDRKITAAIDEAILNQDPTRGPLDDDEEYNEWMRHTATHGRGAGKAAATAWIEEGNAPAVSRQAAARDAAEVAYTTGYNDAARHYRNREIAADAIHRQELIKAVSSLEEFTDKELKKELKRRKQP